MNAAERTLSEQAVERLREIDKMFEDGVASTYDNGYDNPDEKEPQVLAGPYELYDLVTEWQGAEKPGLLAVAADTIESLQAENERLRGVEAMAKGILEELDGQEILVSTGIKASFLAEALGMKK